MMSQSDTKFRVIVADPPWSFNDKLPGPKRGVASHYSVQSVDDLKRFPLPPLEDDSLLFMWRVSSQVAEAYALVDAWGFAAKTEIVWYKTTATGKPHFGMGHYVRASHESCIVATRGRAASQIRDRAVRSVFSAPVGRHSEKPVAFYDIVERLVPGPYFELFARKHRPGWVCEGGELGNYVDLAALDQPLSE